MMPIGILGVGASSPFGNGVEALWAGCVLAQRIVRPITSYSTAGMKHVTAALQEPRTTEASAPVAAMAIAAALEAVRMAQLKKPRSTWGRVGLMLATAPGEPDELRLINESLVGLSAPGCPSVGPALSPAQWGAVLEDSVAHAIRSAFEWDDVLCLSVSAACASANVALGIAAEALADGFVDTILVVTSESIPRLTQAGFAQVNALSPTLVRPFSAERNGTLIGEGAAAFVLVRVGDEVHSVLATISGVGHGCDALHPVHSQAEGLGIEAATRAALASARITPADVDVIYLHGTGTRQSDSAEARAMGRIFADPYPLAAAIKAVIGHSLGAASGLSAVCGMKTLSTGIVPPTPDVEPIDPECRLRFASEAVHLGKVRNVLNNGYGFGGLNSSLVLSAWR